ncbi:MAG: DUF1376 domain-containing protein [Alphaproteobacteria bacterium]
MSGLSRFDFFPRDWHLDTRELTPGAKGIYVDILCAMYARGGPLPADERELCRITACATVRSLRPLLTELIDAGKLHLRDGFLINNRTMEELAKADALREQGRQGGKARSARVRAEFGSNSTGTQPETRGQIEENQSHNVKPLSPSPSKKKEKMAKSREDYRFAGEVISLNDRDFTKLATRYHAIPDLEAELGGIDEWWNCKHPPGDKERAKWWLPLLGMLNKKHQELLEKRQQGTPGRSSDVAAEVDKFYREQGVRT